MSDAGVVGRDSSRRPGPSSRVAAAVATVADPEFPGVSVVDSGSWSRSESTVTAGFGCRSCRRSPAAPRSR